MASRLRAVVADDSAVVRELISVNLQMEGFQVATAPDGQAALELVDQVRPHVVTLDERMPRLSGSETVLRLRANPQTAHLPVVIVSSCAQASDIERGQEVGADAYVTKPFEPAKLVDLVTRLAMLGRERVPE